MAQKKASLFHVSGVHGLFGAREQDLTLKISVFVLTHVATAELTQEWFYVTAEAADGEYPHDLQCHIRAWDTGAAKREGQI